jgi:hypothetical protein
MSRARTVAFIGLAGLGLWSAAAPVRAGQPSFVRSTIEAFVPASTMGTGNIQADCTFNGKQLSGKVQVVESFPDIRVRVVTSFPDLKVKQVRSFADSCGEWQMVESFPDFKIQYVDSFPDIEVAWVDSFPGMP